MHFQISNDRLVIDGRAAQFVPAAPGNQGGRIEASLIVVHDTADRLRPDDSVNWFADPKSKVSAHFVVGRDGSITQMVDCDRAAYHAGKSSWQGRANCNGFSIGIEIDNPGPLKDDGKGGARAWFGETFDIAQHGIREIATPEHGRALWMPYAAAQLDAVERLVRALLIAYPAINSLAGHYEVSPRRKTDVGPQFPMSHFKAILGDRRAPDADKVKIAQHRLAALNYWPGADDGVLGVRARSAVRTFEEQNGLPVTGGLGTATFAALMSDGAKEMPAAAREDTSKAELAAAGSETISSAAATKRASEVGQAFNLADAFAQVQQAQASQGVLDWLMSPAGLKCVATFVVLTLIWKFADKIEWARLRDHVLGRNVGG